MRNLKATRRPIALRVLHLITLGLLLAGLIVPSDSAAAAQNLGPVSVQLIGDHQPDEGSALMGIEFRLQPGWATYWRAPGEAGIAPAFDWTASTNLADAQVLWPAPERLVEGGFTSFGYRDRVILPVIARSRRAHQPIKARLTLDFAVCGRVCVPKRAELALDPVRSDTQARREIQSFQNQVPRPSRPDLSAAIVFRADRLVVALTAMPPLAAGDRLDLIAEGPDGPLAAAPEVRRAPDGRTATLALAPPDAAKLAQTLTLTVIAGPRALSLVARRGEER